MLYIEKGVCPSEILAEIDAIKNSEEWQDIPDPANQCLDGEEKRLATKRIRVCFNRLNKMRIRESLLAEQHYLCAYCMHPIKNESLHTSIEHWTPLSKSKEHALDYLNFVATCKGGSDIRDLTPSQRLTCCDAQKGDNDSITLDPRNREMIAGITYLHDGIIVYRDTPPFDRLSIQNDIDNVLRLNGKLDQEGFCRQDTSTQLVKQRRDVYQNTEKVCLDCLNLGTLTTEWLNAKIEECLSQEHRERFAGVAIFVYKIYLKRLQKQAETG